MDTLLFVEVVLMLAVTGWTIASAPTSCDRRADDQAREEHARIMQAIALSVF
jgi:hypothetical protein